MKPEEKPRDFELDGMEHANMTPEEIEHHKFTRRYINRLEIGVLISAPITLIGYGAYRCLPTHAQETLQNLPNETYNICSDLYQYIAQFIS
jgi:hypothetical protein